MAEGVYERYTFFRKGYEDQGDQTFELDTRERTLKLGGKELKKPLKGKDFDVLAYLVKNNKRLTTYARLIERIWDNKDTIDDSNVTSSVSRIRNSLGDSRTYIETIPGEGYRFTADRQITPLAVDDDLPNAIDMKTESGSAQNNAQPDFSALGTIHVHVDGVDRDQLVDDIVGEFRKKQRPSKKNRIIDDEPGPQRQSKPTTYEHHTPGGVEKKKKLEYFSTHLFGGFAATKRDLKQLLSMLYDSGVKNVVVEAERIIGKIGDENADWVWASPYHRHYPAICSGDVGYEKLESDAIEVHYAVDIARDVEWRHKPPLTCAQLRDISNDLGIDVGGWFLFEKADETIWAFRSNMFESDVCQEDLENDRQNIKSKLEEKGIKCNVKALVEQTIGIWQTPLKPFNEPISLIELSNWEALYPDLRDFWVVTPNFLADKKKVIEKAMIRNLKRGVTYTYFLRSIADYNRLMSLAEYFDGRVGPHVNVFEKIQAIMVTTDVSEPGALRKAFEPDHGQGCFIANPIPSKHGHDDIDGYALVESKDPGEISGGKAIEYERLRDIVSLLEPLVPSGRLSNDWHPLQGFRMPRIPHRNEEVPGATVVCIGLKNLPDLLNDIDDDGVAAQLREYDLLVASETSKRGGQVVRSIEPGYLLMFDKQDGALFCAEQIHKETNPVLQQRIAIESGDVWRVMRAHGTELCGETVTRCRALLKKTKYGEVTTTDSFRNSLAQRFRAKLTLSGIEFDLAGNKTKVWKLTT